MVDGNPFNIPLSPPTSPRMNPYHHSEVESSWQQQQPKVIETTPDSSDGHMGLSHGDSPDLMEKPMLHSHKSYPYPLQTSSNSMQQPNTPPLNSSGGSPNTAAPEGLGITGLTDVGNDMPSVSFGNSAPTSPMSHMTPTSPRDGDEHQDLNGLNIHMDDVKEKDDKPMTAAEIRAQKRKMKRFRLTHNQTRFLMSEFARQAHPDAAHRERLAREIPGLSPRQVQVWFQNRRAKLKRLTSDDRERMMKSRELPPDFDMTQALHSPFGQPHGMGSTLSSPSSYSPAFSEGNMIRPLNIDSLRRVPDNSHMSPTNIAPSFGGYNFTPPQSVTDTLSPVSPAGDSPFNYSPTLDQSPRRSNPFATSPSNFTSHPSIPRLRMQDGVTRSRGDSLSSPLRTSMSYSGPSDMNISSPTLSGGPLSGDNNGQNGMLPYGLGYSYSSTMPGYPATANSRMRSYSNNGMPRRMDMSNTSYSPSRSSAPQTTSPFSTYSGSPLHTPNSFSMMSAPQHVTSFPSSYMRQDGGSSEPFPSVGELVNDDNGSQHGDNGDNHDNGMPSLSSF
ncbi:homeobox-domain-containing protein [Trichodelitschia bisporula]|uniref:Homeobox-domain-containing protein n=1 Tax=Trichodelitschia bisporula TaxID=703511 RepID=A0A6G1HJZ0_9PEZI|nr:homeobox-domain-containing protein [Trichodelitschia bisporula]